MALSSLEASLGGRVAAETDQEHGAATGGGVDPPGAAWAVLGSADREKANRFLDEQTVLTQKQQHLVDLQAHELQHELSLRHWSLRVRHVSDVLKLAFELAFAFIVTAIAIGLGIVIWSAVHADGLVIESFNVPADMAANGLSGQVVSAKLLDRLAMMQNASASSRPAASFTNDWTHDMKVEIPDTGVSLGELQRYLRNWLGHEPLRSRARQIRGGKQIRSQLGTAVRALHG